MIISLCGFMGAGKSTIGKHLANWLGFRFTDLDSYIEKKFGCTVSAFFAASGEERFREEEYNALSEIFADNGKDLILALGGGTLTKPECAELVKSKSTVIYLYCNEEALFKRLVKGKAKRPLLADKSDAELKEHIRNLVSKRESAYTSAASITVDTSVWSISGIIGEISAKLPPYQENGKY